jgi:hypothetical protein
MTDQVTWAEYLLPITSLSVASPCDLYATLLLQRQWRFHVFPPIAVTDCGAAAAVAVLTSMDSSRFGATVRLDV